MIDIKLIRENSELVKENIRKKFQDDKIKTVDEIIDLDKEFRQCKLKGDNLRALKNEKSNEIGKLMKDNKQREANEVKEQISKYAEEIKYLEEKEFTLEQQIKEKMLIIPQIIDDSVPIGKDDSENVEIEKFGDPFVPDYEIPYHSDICESFNGLDKESAGRVSGNGFY